jgi:hypothetical protein
MYFLVSGQQTVEAQWNPLPAPGLFDKFATLSQSAIRVCGEIIRWARPKSNRMFGRSELEKAIAGLN